MSVGYRQRKGDWLPITSARALAKWIEDRGYCQGISGYSLDRAVGALLVDTVTIAVSMNHPVQRLTTRSTRFGDIILANDSRPVGTGQKHKPRSERKWIRNPSAQ
jgi:hypothetical protein